MSMRFKLKKRYFYRKVSLGRRRDFSAAILSLVFLVLVVSGFYMLDFRIRPTLGRLAEAKAKQVATRAINEAISTNISTNIQYQHIIHVNFDTDGKVAFMQPNTGEINRISAMATLAVQNRIKKLSRQIINIPVGQVFGLKILGGLGPNLPVRVFSVGIAESKIQDRFDVAGINQIRHRIYITVKTVIKMVVPLINQEVQVSTSVLLTEAIVMGEVPNIYVGNGNNGLILPQTSR
jgi:sporulation protein YunB